MYLTKKSLFKLRSENADYFFDTLKLGACRFTIYDGMCGVSTHIW